MQTQTIFRAGNSQVIAIPKNFGKQGEKVVVETTSNGEVLVVRKESFVSSKKTSKKEFNKWLGVFMKENGEILDELALR